MVASDLPASSLSNGEDMHWLSDPRRSTSGWVVRVYACGTFNGRGSIGNWMPEPRVEDPI